MVTMKVTIFSMSCMDHLSFTICYNHLSQKWPKRVYIYIYIYRIHGTYGIARTWLNIRELQPRRKELNEVVPGRPTLCVGGADRKCLGGRWGFGDGSVSQGPREYFQVSKFKNNIFQGPRFFKPRVFKVSHCVFWGCCMPYFGGMTSHLPFMVLFTRAKGTRIATRVSEGLGDKGSVPKNTGLNHTDPYCRIGDWTSRRLL